MFENSTNIIAIGIHHIKVKIPGGGVINSDESMASAYDFRKLLFCRKDLSIESNN